MDDFKDIEIEHLEEIIKYTKYQNYRTCDYTFGVMYMWGTFFKTQYTVFEDMLLLKTRDDKKCNFIFPVGNGSLEDALDHIMSFCKNNELVFSGVPKDAVEILKEKYGEDNVTAISQRDSADYLYLKKDLVELIGKKYSRIRNHINKFKSSFGTYEFEFVSESNLDTVKEFYKDFMEANKSDDVYATHDLKATKDILENFLKLNLIGGIIKLGDKIVAMTMGTMMNDTIYVHIEKANREFSGAYQVINQEFLKHIGDEIIYVNREDDLGIEGIRKAKLSYRPIELLEKYDVHIKK